MFRLFALQSRLKSLFLLGGIQLLSACALILWWGYLLVHQAIMISGYDANFDRDSYISMIIWEGLWFFLVIGLGLTLLYVLFARDSRRVQAFQAFFATMSHELRTPLTSLRLQAEMLHSLQDDSSPNQNSSTRIQKILDDIELIEEQIDRSLELTKLTANSKMLFEKIVISEEITAICYRYQDKIDFDLTKLDKNISLRVDRHAIQVIFKNLISNVIKHAEVEKTRYRIKIFSKNAANSVQIFFSDNGKAIVDDFNSSDKIFVKGKHSTGQGLGLYLSRQLMRLMGGDLIVKTKPSFLIELVFKKVRP